MKNARFVLLSTLSWLCCVAGCSGLRPSAPLVTSYAALSRLPEGTRVVVHGTVATEIWQHPIERIDGYSKWTYLDFADGQTVMYSKTELPMSAARVEITGTVHVLDAASKRPSSTERVTAWQILAESWRSLR